MFGLLIGDFSQSLLRYINPALLRLVLASSSGSCFAPYNYYLARGTGSPDSGLLRPASLVEQAGAESYADACPTQGCL
jgi:hypothetical protein